MFFSIMPELTHNNINQWQSSKVIDLKHHSAEIEVPTGPFSYMNFQKQVSVIWTLVVISLADKEPKL